MAGGVCLTHAEPLLAWLQFLMFFVLIYYHGLYKYLRDTEKLALLKPAL